MSQPEPPKLPAPPEPPPKSITSVLSDRAVVLSTLILVATTVFAGYLHGGSRVSTYLLIMAWALYLWAIIAGALESARKPDPDGKKRETTLTGRLVRNPLLAFILATVLLAMSGGVRVLSETATPPDPNGAGGTGRHPGPCPDCSAPFCANLTAAWGSFETEFTNDFKAEFFKNFKVELNNTFKGVLEATLKAELRAYFDDPESYVNTQISLMRRCCRRPPIKVRGRRKKCDCPTVVNPPAQGGKVGAAQTRVGR